MLWYLLRMLSKQVLLRNVLARSRHDYTFPQADKRLYTQTLSFCVQMGRSRIQTLDEHFWADQGLESTCTSPADFCSRDHKTCLILVQRT